MNLIMRSSIGLTSALVILWFATVAGIGGQRAFDQARGMAVDGPLPTTELFALFTAALIVCAFSIAAWRGWREERQSVGRATVLRAETKGGEADAGGHRADEPNDLSVGCGHLRLMGR